jgi:DNA-binding NtrC family response regulator
MTDKTTPVRRVLVVDDDEAALELMRSFLERDKIEVATATNAADATALAKREVFDAYLVDKNLPDEQMGVDLIRTLTEIDPGAVVLVITAHGSVDSVYDAVRAGASGYLLKPFTSATDVLRAVQDAVSRSQARHRAVRGLREARRVTGQMRAVSIPPPPVPLEQIHLRVLVLSADPIVTERAGQTAALGKWALRAFARFDEALAALKESRDDAVIVDGTLGESALRLLAQARASYPEIGIVFIGSSLNFAESRDLVGLGALAQSPKLPDDPQHLGELVLTACTRARAARRGGR